MSDDIDPQPENALMALVRILVEPLQEVETVFQQLLTECGVLTAVGAQLDVVGKLVGAKRQGLTDEVYRRHIRAQILANKSSGTINELLAIARLVVLDDLATFVFDNIGNATYRLLLELETTEELARIVAAFVQRGTSAGVRGIVQFGISPPAGWFRFDSGPGFDIGRLTGQIG